MRSLYRELKAAGVPLDNHESDLYAPNTVQVRKILNRHPAKRANATTFVVQSGHPHAGELWLDIPFAFDPWWEARTKAG